MGSSYFPKQSTILVTSCRGPGSNRFWCRRSSCNTPPRRWHRLAGRGYRGGLQVGPPAFLGSCYTTKKDCGLVKSRTGQGPPETGWHGIGHPSPGRNPQGSQWGRRGGGGPMGPRVEIPRYHRRGSGLALAPHAWPKPHPPSWAFLSVTASALAPRRPMPPECPPLFPLPPKEGPCG